MSFLPRQLRRIFITFAEIGLDLVPPRWLVHAGHAWSLVRVIPVMNRADLQRVAVRRLGAAESLIGSGHWDSPYYLAGYAIECGLKLSWATVKDWSEDSRYEDRTRKEATAIIEAIEDAQHGVLEWIKAYW
ncbi:MAG: hypothetical protein JWO48_856 [Bryobacterales bacterium]|nr:hypothetical protein [Bryobacterales bacterium]